MTSFNMGSGSRPIPASNLKEMFFRCIRLTNVTITVSEAAKITRQMFEYCNELSNLNFGFENGNNNIEDMYAMFNNCFMLTTTPVRPGKHTHMFRGMYNECYRITAFTSDFFDELLNLDIPGYSACDGKECFKGCTGLQSPVPVSTIMTIANADVMVDLLGAFYQCNMIPNINALPSYMRNSS